MVRSAGSGSIQGCKWTGITVGYGQGLTGECWRENGDMSRPGAFTAG